MWPLCKTWLVKDTMKNYEQSKLNFHSLTEVLEQTIILVDQASNSTMCYKRNNILRAFLKDGRKANQKGSKSHCLLVRIISIWFIEALEPVSPISSSQGERPKTSKGAYSIRSFYCKIESRIQIFKTHISGLPFTRKSRNK